MKKIYIQPETICVKIEASEMIAGGDSMTRGGDIIDDAGDILVKGNVHHYDVWEDDWSAENDE